MPPYLTHKSNTYYFRQGVPAELRSIIGKREIKKSLGSDYAKAIRECKRFAVEADNLLADARAKLDSIPVAPYSREGILRTKHLPITEVTPSLERLVANLTKSALLETDQQTRMDGMSADEFNTYGAEIQLSIEALRKQLAMGNVDSMVESAKLILIGRGYSPNLSDRDYRRLAYVMTESTLEAYEAIALRQSGQVVKQPSDEVLPSQFELQNQAKLTQATSPKLTWQELYEVWVKECYRGDNTRSAYLAATTRFMSFCKSAPNEVTREDVLAYRDHLLQGNGVGDPPAAGTVANKIGFLCTLINSGRNNSKYARLLPHNPFAGIKIKQSMRGKAGEKRLPFSDEDLKTILDQPSIRKAAAHVAVAVKLRHGFLPLPTSRVFALNKLRHCTNGSSTGTQKATTTFTPKTAKIGTAQIEMYRSILCSLKQAYSTTSPIAQVVCSPRLNAQTKRRARPTRHGMAAS